nr:Coenzyme F420 hydrogenase/dehydrogenase, beta subunit C-terminal domain [uncultured Anaerobutyricum sp.]
MKCSGCGACAIICPKHCIKMLNNEEGFLRPVINKDKCVNCNLCKKVCIYNNCEVNALDSAALFSAYSSIRKNRETTSSGGVAFEIANDAILNKMLVCGAVFDYDTFTVKHKLCLSKKEIEHLKGSKYLQSNCIDGFLETVQNLKENKKLYAVIFGTPCQISGLNNVLCHEHIRDRVILVDIFCHGVPSALLWKRYLEFLWNKKKIKKNEIQKIIFRDKKYSWHSYYMHIYHKKGEYVKSRKKDPFLKLFSLGCLNQKECFSCPFRNNSSADIRLGDFWGKRYDNSEEGYSMVLLLTNRGKTYFERLSNIEKKSLSIEERFGQQHKDYLVPQNYKLGLKMLKDNRDLFKIINLYDPLLQRIKRELKLEIKKLLNINK